MQIGQSWEIFKVFQEQKKNIFEEFKKIEDFVKLCGAKSKNSEANEGNLILFNAIS